MRILLLLLLCFIVSGCQTNNIQPNYLGDVMTINSSRFVNDMTASMVIQNAENVLLEKGFSITVSDHRNNRVEATKNVLGGFCHIEINVYPSSSGVNLQIVTKVPQETGSGKDIPGLILDSFN